jgi:quercetin dioxygenase-like cupin family protein
LVLDNKNMSGEYPKILLGTVEELETLSGLSKAGWVVSSWELEDSSNSIEVFRHSDRLIPSEENIINRLRLTDEQGNLRQGYTLEQDSRGNTRFGYQGSTYQELEDFIGALTEFGFDLLVADFIISDYERRQLKASLVVDKPGTVYPPHKHSAVRIETVSGSAQVRLDEDEWHGIEPGEGFIIADNQMHEAKVGNEPWMYVIAGEE